MDNRSIKNRLYHTNIHKSPKNQFHLEDDTLVPVLKPKKLQQALSPTNAKTNPMFKSAKLSFNFPDPQIIKKVPKQVSQQKLSKQAKSIIEEGKNRVRTNLKPYEIFQLYDNFPQMLQDFFYLNRLSHPYDYQIVTYNQRNSAEYMTISSQGVTLYHEKEAQFLTKQEWLIDQKRYYALQKIYFFKQYKLCKNFRIWKNKMRRHYMREMSTILNENIFLSFKFPRSCLLEVKQLTNTLRESLYFLPFDNIDKLSPSQFLIMTDEYREKTLLKGIKQTTDRITQILQCAVSEEINKFKQQNNIKIEGVNEKHLINKQGYIYSQQAILRKQYKRVYKLIKLADSILQEAKVQMVLRCLQQLKDKIKELHTEDKEPWITCTATITQNGNINWQPDCPSLCQLFLRSIQSNIQILNEHNQKIINNPCFSKYRMIDGQTKNEQSKNTFKIMIEQSHNYQNLLLEIKQSLSQQFQSTQKQESSLQKFIQIYLRHKKLEQMNKIFHQNNSVQLCNYVDQWKKDERDMYEMAQNKKGKLLFYNYTDLRKKIINSPRQTLNCFFSLLPQETSGRCRDLMNESKALLDGISIYPTEIVSFAKFNKAVKQAAQRLDDIRSAGSEICLLIDLMSKNKLSNVEIYNTKKIQALNSINALKNKVDESEAKENESLSKFKKDNEYELIKIKTIVKDLSAKFNAIQFNQCKTTTRQMKEILSKIRQILPSINNLEAQSLKIQYIQIDLSLTQTDFSEVHQLYENAKIVNDIWTCRDNWKSLLVNLYHKHYCEVECLELKQKWQQFSNQINGMLKILPDNEILKNLTQQLIEVQILIDTIVALRSPNLQQKSWKQISEYLGYELGLENESELPFNNIKNPDYTVKWLLQINIPIYKQKIQFIVQKSQKQKELIVHLSQYRNYISNLTFEIVPKKRQVYTFGENGEVQLKIHQNIAHLYAMLDNQYSQSIKNQAESLIRHYEYVQEIIKAAFQYGQVWSKYETFFDSNSTCLKLLAKESKQFSSWQTQWKKIIKNITTDSILFYRKVCDQTTGINSSRSTIKQIAKVNTTIDQVKKGLDQYLEKKRLTFPRYFFLTDQQLLQMFAKIDPHEPICACLVPLIYKNIQKIVYKEDTKDTLLGIISKDSEEFILKNVNFKLQSEMEDIFKLTEEQIKKRMSYLIKNVFAKYSDQQVTREKMIMDNNTQVVLAIDSIAWVRLAEETYLCTEPIGDLYDWIQIQEQQIRELVNLLSKDLVVYDQYKLMQLMSQSVYFREKTEYLLKQEIKCTDCYEWERIPKLYMANSNSDIYLKQLGNKLNYCFQFLGNKSVSFITPQTERAWINISQAITARQVVSFHNYDGGNIQTIKELAYLIAQDVQQVQLGEKFNFKMVQRYINGALFTGNWVVFNQPSTPEMLAFMANQITHIKKALLESNLVINNKNVLTFNPNVSFFLSLGPQEGCDVENLLNPFIHRHVSLVKPNLSKILQITCKCKGYDCELGVKTVSVSQIMKNCFKRNYYEIDSKQFLLCVLQQAHRIMPQYNWLKSLKCKQYYQYIICETLDLLWHPMLQKEDVKVYDMLKNSIVPDYEKLKLKKDILHNNQNVYSINKFLDDRQLSFLKNHQTIDQIDLLSKCLTTRNIGAIVYGQPLTGKSTLIDLTASFLQLSSDLTIKQHKIYHNAYKREEIFSYDKNPAIFSQCLCDIRTINWIVFDGQVFPDYIDLFGRTADKYVVPQIGTITSDCKIKFILQTYQTSKVSPSVIGNHSLIYIGDTLSAETIVRKTFIKLQKRTLLSNLQTETVEWIIMGLANALSKLQTKGILKSKMINFVYPVNNWEISHRCCRLVQAVFTMNWQSIREKDKTMRKLIDRFVSWILYWSLSGIVFLEDQSKLQKFIVQICKSETSEEYAKCIIYPGCGLQVQQINGLRTQSSLGIPEKGIITNLLRTDLIPESDSQKGNKFYEQIVISEPQLIRVNYNQSNKFNYLAQLSNYTDTPIILLGAPNTGRKSIIELYAKNMKNKSQFYSIRYLNRQNLTSQIERPFRKMVGLDGLVMKSMIPSKKLIISIEDVFLNQQHRSTIEFMRVIVNQKGYHNRQAQWVKLTHCSFALLINKLGYTLDNARLLPRVSVFQTNNNSIQKLYSIFAPYLKNWCSFNGMNGEAERIFSSQNGDSVLDATLSIYKLFSQFYQSSEKTSVESLLIRPRIGDISKVLGYICRTPDANHYNMTYYYELWVHQIVRVFSDRVVNPKYKELLYKQIKKEALMKFKQNFSLNDETMFTFTGLGMENENSYIRIEDPSFLHSYISTLLEGDQIPLPLKYLFNQLLQYILRIYRIISIEGSHLLLICHNVATADYLIQLSCYVGQNDFYKLNGQLVSLEKHIEPTLFYKDNVCLIQRIQKLTDQSTYQMACLLNGNIYDFGLKGEMREKIKASLIKKQKPQIQKKQSRLFGKSKTQQLKPEQKEEDTEVMMAQQFMNYAHLILQAQPLDPKLRTFLARQGDIVGKLHYCWLHMPQQSTIKVAKQILNFDQEMTEAVVEGQSDEKLVEKVRLIYASLAREDQYFNDLLTICELVKGETNRVGNIYNAKEKELKQGREYMSKIKNIISQKEQMIRCLQQQLEEVNASLEQKCRSLQEINNKIGECQMNGEEGNSQVLSDMKVHREETQIDLKIVRERKDRLEPQKKQILKSIKIANDYLDIFNNSSLQFDSQIENVQYQSSIIQDKLVLIWSAISYLAKTPTNLWINTINQWIQLLNSKIAPLTCIDQLLDMMSQIIPLSLIRWDVFNAEVRIKVQSLIMLLQNYDDTVMYGHFVKLYDPKAIFPTVLQHFNTENNSAYSLLKQFPQFNREMRSEIESLCRVKNGLILIEDSKDIDQLELYLLDKKLGNYFNKIIVLSNKEQAHFTIQCSIEQLNMSIYAFILKQANPGMHREKDDFFQQIAREKKKKHDNQQYFYKACANINIETETYTEQLNRHKQIIQSVDKTLANLQEQAQSKKYVELPEFEMAASILKSLGSLWIKDQGSINFKHLISVYQQAIYLKNGSESENMTLQQKGQELQKTVAVNLGSSRQMDLCTYLKYNKKWDKKIKLFIIQPSRPILAMLQLQKEYRPLNLLTTMGLLAHLNQHSEIHKILYNYIQQLHSNIINQIIDRFYAEPQDNKCSSLIMMVDLSQLKALESSKIAIIPIQITLELNKEQPKIESKVKGLQNLRQFLAQVGSNTENDNLILAQIQKNCESARNQKQVVKLVCDFMPAYSETVINFLLNSNLNVGSLLLKVKDKKERKERKTIQLKNMDLNIIKEELPFLFNFSQFAATKDPLGLEMVAECGRFNKKLKNIKDKLKETQFQWEDVQKVQTLPNDYEIMSLNHQYIGLKKNLVKQHILPVTSSNSKVASHKTISTTNLTFQNVLRLPLQLVTPKILAIIKCKASKKYKVGLSNISLIWKICNSSFNFEESFTSPELCLIVQGRLQQGNYLLSNWSRREEVDKKIDIMAYAVQSSHDVKNNNQSIYVPIKNKGEVVGNLQIGRSQLGSEYVWGLQQVFISLEGVQA